MTGSVIDGEDVVQEALVKATEAFPDAGSIADLEGWLFRIATMRRWTFCAAAPGRNAAAPTRTRI